MKNTKKPKYAIVEPVGGHGGNELYIYRLARALSPNYKVLVYTSDETQLHKCHETQSETFLYFRGIYGSRPVVRRLLAYLFALVRVHRGVIAEKASIVHLHVFHFNILELGMVVLFRFFTGAKIWVTVHDVQSFANFGRATGYGRQRFVCRLAHKLIVHTQYASQLLKGKIAPVDQRKLIVTPAGDLDFLYNHPVPRAVALSQLELDSEYRYVLFFGQIKRVKGLDVLLEAAQKVQNQLRERRVKLLIVGKVWKDNWGRYEDMINSAGVLDLVVRFGSYVSNEAVPLFFYASELVILPYREIYNSGVLLRAMDYGTPIIASSVPVFQESITRETGVLFQSESADDLSRALLDALDHPEEMLAKALAAKIVVETKNADGAILSAMT